MAFGKSILSQIMGFVNIYDFKKQVSKYSRDFRTRKFTCYNLLVTMIYVHLKSNPTIRDIVRGFGLMTSNFYHLGLQSVKKSTLSDALRNRSHKIFENYFYSLLESLNRRQRRRLNKSKIHLIDATTISLCIDQFSWATYKSTKGGIKMHTMIDLENKIPEKVIITEAKTHDIKGIKNMIKFQKGDIYVYDRGYASYKYLYNIELNGAYFVTCLKSNWKYQIIESKIPVENTGILSDDIIIITGTKVNDYPKPIRMVVFYHEEEDKIYRFLTNNLNESAERIAEIYKSRWQIELFFKWIKQHLKIKSFLSTSENGVKIQIWIALITYVLLSILQSLVICEIELHEIFKRLSECLDKRIHIFELLTLKIEATRNPIIIQDFDQLELNYVF